MDEKFGLMLRNHNDVYTFRYDPSSSTCKGIGQMTYPVSSYKDGIEFFGCCNGLVLLRHVNQNYSHVLILWNPTTDEFKKIPFPTFKKMDLLITEQCLDYVEYGIGYNSRSKDFKVVGIGNFEGSFAVMVYSLKNNKWKGVDNFEIDSLVHREVPDMARLPVNGAVHWIAKLDPSEATEVIFYFDFESEQFSEMPMPDLFDENSETSLCVLGGSLCLLGFTPKVGADVWEIKQDGAEKSWTKLFTIDLQKHFAGMVTDLMPLQSLKDGNILLGLDMDSGFHIVSYDPKQDTTRILNVQEFQKAGSFHTSVFGESQVSLNTGTYLGNVRFANSDKEDDGDDSDDDHNDDSDYDQNDDSDEDYCDSSDSGDDDDDDEEEEDLQHNKKKSKKM